MNGQPYVWLGANPAEWLAAIGTLLATFTALYLAVRVPKPHYVAWLGYDTPRKDLDTGVTAFQFIELHVQNTGQIPFGVIDAELNMLQIPIGGSRRYRALIEPRELLHHGDKILIRLPLFSFVPVVNPEEPTKRLRLKKRPYGSVSFRLTTGDVTYIRVADWAAHALAGNNPGVVPVAPESPDWETTSFLRLSPPGANSEREG